MKVANPHWTHRRNSTHVNTSKENLRLNISSLNPFPKLFENVSWHTNPIEVVSVYEFSFAQTLNFFRLWILFHPKLTYTSSTGVRLQLKEGPMVGNNLRQWSTLPFKKCDRKWNTDLRRWKWNLVMVMVRKPDTLFQERQATLLKF